jgi:methylation protein EvaC
MIEKTSYDQIYDEHVFMFSATNVAEAFVRHGLELIDVLPQVTHGGSMRYVLAPKGSHKISLAVAAQLKKEEELGLSTKAAYARFKANCEASKRELVALLEDLKTNGKRVAGYGATSKSTTVMNYCGIDGRHIEFISDTTPIKQGKLTPGSHIPVKSYDAFTENYPDYAVLFAWNHGKEIREKEGAYRDAGGKWILFVPKVHVE